MLRTASSMSVEGKMTAVLFAAMVAFPLTALVFWHSGAQQAVINFMVGFLVVGIILVVPLAKWLSQVIALRSIRELNAQCQLLKRGEYVLTEAPPDEEDGHDFANLKRNMHWMGHAIASRQRRLTTAMQSLAEARNQILESIDYASHIQAAFLPDEAELAAVLPDHFLLWLQRDVVGGDAYWVKPWGEGFFVGVIDCTGHGVPGAFMTLIVQSLLEKALVVGDTSPAGVLARTNALIKDALGQKGGDARSDDGMDCALCHIAPGSSRLVFAGANTPLYVVEAGAARRIRGDRCGLGHVRSPRDFVFSDVEVALSPGVRVCMATDGIVDQVGGPRRLPFGKSRLMRFLEDRADQPVGGLGEELLALVNAYQGEEPRRDDMTVLGFDVR
ncbi:PP2C family protein-serine/threonine phosphatase [Pseudodesulfovibrio alkaliphilus]|uniref:PP2C family protein-serine/threonine phosphatase n=1 Tax=Pseudodesulfovibrio alkaliphilus TaxID=2661613 RepID=UPI001E37C015|nr:SpoIIE family protein phosphatase [Pseudodesulfovibrio alkaliphilus]